MAARARRGVKSDEAAVASGRQQYDQLSSRPQKPDWSKRAKEVSAEQLNSEIVAWRESERAWIEQERVQLADGQRETNNAHGHDGRLRRARDLLITETRDAEKAVSGDAGALVDESYAAALDRLVATENVLDGLQRLGEDHERATRGVRAMRESLKKLTPEKEDRAVEAYRAMRTSADTKTAAAKDIAAKFNVSFDAIRRLLIRKGIWHADATMPRGKRGRSRRHSGHEPVLTSVNPGAPANHVNGPSKRGAPEDLFRAEKERARSSTTSRHARQLAEAKAAFDNLMAEGQAARKSGRPRKHPLPKSKTTR